MGSENEWLGITHHILDKYSKLNITTEEIKDYIFDKYFDSDILDAINQVYSGHGKSKKFCKEFCNHMRDDVRKGILKYMDMDLEELRQLLIASHRK